MYQQQQGIEMPLSTAFGYNINQINHFDKPRSYLQVNELSNNINPIGQLVPQFLNVRSVNDAYFSPNYQPQYPVPSNYPQETFIPFQNGHDVIYYGAQQEQTCTNLQTFVKEPKEKHFCMMILNIILFALILTGLVLIVRVKLPVWLLAQFVGVPLIFYFILGLFSNSLKPYFSNMMPYNHIEGVFQQLKKQAGHIKFTAQCYHFTAGKHRKRLVTHTANHIIPVRQCVDICQNLVELKENKRYILYTIKQYFCFGDQNSQNAFINAFTLFRNSNVKDEHQIFSHKLEINSPEIAGHNGLGETGTGDYVNSMYVVFLLLGLGWPYLIAIEFLSQRYSINITKRLTL